MKNYYEILEVNKKASKEIIEKAYKVLVKRYHPDLYSGSKKEYAEEKIKEINEAYQILSDEFLKEQYDKELEKEENRKYAEYRIKAEENAKQDYNNSQKQNIKEVNVKKNKKIEKRYVTGNFADIIEFCKELFKNKPKREELKNMTKKDVLAILITIIIVILIGVILWFIPFTNGWIRELTIENPIFKWIGDIFIK